MTIKVGNAPCSWGTLEFDSTQSSTQNRRIPYEQMLDEVVQSGYEGSELGNYGFMPTTPTELSAAFRDRGLNLTGAYTGINLRSPEAAEKGLALAVRNARLLAATAEALDQPFRPYIVLADDNATDPMRTQHAGRVQPEMMLSETEAQQFADRVNRIARAVKEATDLPVVFHPHCAGFVETPEEIDRLAAQTDPEVVGLVFDTGHFSYGAYGCGTSGGEQTGACDREDMLAFLKKLGDRVWYVHLKDFDPAVGDQAIAQAWDYFEAIRHGVFCELGKGSVDFPGVLAWLQQRSYQGFVTVEQDVLSGMGSPLESALRNRQYLQDIGL